MITALNSDETLDDAVTVSGVTIEDTEHVQIEMTLTATISILMSVFKDSMNHELKGIGGMVGTALAFDVEQDLAPAIQRKVDAYLESIAPPAPEPT